MAKIQCVLSHYCTLFHETIYKGTNTCVAWKQGMSVNWFMEIMVVMKQIESIELMESFDLEEM